MSGAKFYPKRFFENECTEVAAGFKRGKVRIRARIPSSGDYIFLSPDDAYDLADLLDNAIADLEENPLEDWVSGP